MSDLWRLCSRHVPRRAGLAASPIAAHCSSPASKQAAIWLTSVPAMWSTDGVMKKTLVGMALVGAAVTLTGCASYPDAGIEEISVIADAICGEDEWVGEDSSSFRKADEGDFFPSTTKYRYSVTCLNADNRDRSQVAEEVAALVGLPFLRTDERQRGYVINPDTDGNWGWVSLMGGKDSFHETTSMNFYLESRRR